MIPTQQKQQRQYLLKRPRQKRQQHIPPQKEHVYDYQKLREHHRCKGREQHYQLQLLQLKQLFRLQQHIRQEHLLSELEKKLTKIHSLRRYVELQHLWLSAWSYFFRRHYWGETRAPGETHESQRCDHQRRTAHRHNHQTPAGSMDGHYVRRWIKENPMDNTGIWADAKRKRRLLLSNASDDESQNDDGRRSLERTRCSNWRLQWSLLPITSERSQGNTESLGYIQCERSHEFHADGAVTIQQLLVLPFRTKSRTSRAESRKTHQRLPGDRTQTERRALSGTGAWQVEHAGRSALVQNRRWRQTSSYESSKVGERTRFAGQTFSYSRNCRSTRHGKCQNKSHTRIHQPATPSDTRILRTRVDKAMYLSHHRPGIRHSVDTLHDQWETRRLQQCRSSRSLPATYLARVRCTRRSNTAASDEIESLGATQLLKFTERACGM